MFFFCEHGTPLPPPTRLTHLPKLPKLSAPTSGRKQQTQTDSRKPQYTHAPTSNLAAIQHA